MTPPAAPTFAAAVVAIGLAVTGCGGGGSSSSSSSGSRSTAQSAAASGRQIFTTVGCSTCHTLADAGAKGQVGPDLDNVKPSATAVAKQVTDGGGGMPAFNTQLSPTQIRAVAKYVAQVAGR
jgi:mono/diheme cytochrome c family protein